MRANEFLNETDLVTPQATNNGDSITINIPMSLLQGQAQPTNEQAMEPTMEPTVRLDPEENEVEVDPSSQQAAELDEIITLAGTGPRVNTTIAAPATNVVPANSVFVSPLQQQLELQKQQGGKTSPIINQILKQDFDTGSSAGEQSEQSVLPRFSE